MKKIIVNEEKQKILLDLIINESITYSDKVNIVKKYLDSSYIKKNVQSIKNGDIQNNKMVVMLDNNGQPTEYVLTLEQLYFKLQYKYQRILSDKQERNKLLWSIVNDWYDNKISKYGNLSKY